MLFSENINLLNHSAHEHNRQTDKITSASLGKNEQNTSNFFAASGGAKSPSPVILEGIRTILAHLIFFRTRRTVSPPGDAENLEETHR